jgi:hypothetical protein
MPERDRLSGIARRGAVDRLDRCRHRGRGGSTEQSDTGDGGTDAGRHGDHHPTAVVEKRRIHARHDKRTLPVSADDEMSYGCPSGVDSL